MHEAPKSRLERGKYIDPESRLRSAILQGSQIDCQDKRYSKPRMTKCIISFPNISQHRSFTTEPNCMFKHSMETVVPKYMLKVRYGNRNKRTKLPCVLVVPVIVHALYAQIGRVSGDYIQIHSLNKYMTDR